MLNVAEALAEPFTFVRIDVYSNGETIAVGEITHINGAGVRRTRPAEAEAEFSRLMLGPAADDEGVFP